MQMAKLGIVGRFFCFFGLFSNMLLALQHSTNIIATSRVCDGPKNLWSRQSSQKYVPLTMNHRAHLGHTVDKPYNIPGGILLKDHKFQVPLDYSNQNPDETLEIFVREMVRENLDSNKELPCLIYLQGGPGYPAGRPRGEGGWFSRALSGHRVFLLDQRGTGKSSPVTHQTLAGKSPEEQARLLKCYRADSIVRDCEAIRKDLTGGKKWTVLGQSFGGFCLLTYLSFFPEGVEKGLFTGGLAPVTRHIDEVYRALAKRQATRNNLFYERYPQAVGMVQRIVKYLDENEVQLPAGGVLTARRFLQLGLGLGSGSGLENLYYLIESAFVSDEPDAELSYSFLRDVENSQSFDTNPIYAILHEPIYCENYAPQWSAERVLAEEGMKELFNYKQSLQEDKPVYFTGEMVFSWMFDGDYSKLAELKQAAELLANDGSWSPLYSVESLKKCQVPCAAAVYYDDLYVERVFSEEIAELMPKCKIWITNEYQHSGLRDDGFNIVDKLFGMAEGKVQVPS